MIYLISFVLLLSLAVNITLVFYIKDLLKKFYYASESASEIFSRFDAYREHLKVIFQQELFYGDKDLKEVIEHTKDLIEFLKKYQGVYSFTQPDLLEILEAENISEEEEEKVDKIFIKRNV